MAPYLFFGMRVASVVVDYGPGGGPYSNPVVIKDNYGQNVGAGVSVAWDSEGVAAMNGSSGGSLEVTVTMSWTDPVSNGSVGVGMVVTLYCPGSLWL